MIDHDTENCMNVTNDRIVNIYQDLPFAKVI